MMPAVELPDRPIIPSPGSIIGVREEVDPLVEQRTRCRRAHKRERHRDRGADAVNEPTESKERPKNRGDR